MFKNTKFFGDVKDDVLEVCYEQEPTRAQVLQVLFRVLKYF